MQAEIVPIRSIYGDTALPFSQEGGSEQNKSDHDMTIPLPLQSGDTLKELVDAKLLIEALENDQLCLIKELEFAQQENNRLMEILSHKDKVESQATITLDDHYTNRDVINRNLDVSSEDNKRIMTNDFQVKLDTMTKDLEDAQFLSSQYLNGNAADLSRKHEAELICAEAEMEASKTILHLQEEVGTLQSELQDTVNSMTEENDSLRIKVAMKEDEKQAEWEKASLELTNILLEGSKSLKDASVQIEYISSLFPHVNNEIRERVERVVEVCMEKEEKIMLLEKSLEDAQKAVLQMDQKLNSLKGAAMVLTEVQQLENCASIKEVTTILDENISMIQLSERKLESKEDQLKEADKCASDALLGLSRLVDRMNSALTDNAEEDSCRSTTTQMVGIKQVLPLENEIQRDLAMRTKETVFNVYNAQSYISSLHNDIHKSAFLYKEVIQEFVTDIQRMKKNWVELKENCRSVQHISESSNDGNDHKMLFQINDELAKINDRLETARACINNLTDMYFLHATAEALPEEDFKIANLSLDSTVSAEITASGLNESSSNCYRFPVMLPMQTLGLESEGGQLQNSAQLVKYSREIQATVCCLRQEFRIIYDAFMKLNLQLAQLMNAKDNSVHFPGKGNCLPLSPIVNNDEQNILDYELFKFTVPETSNFLQPAELVIQAKAGCFNLKKVVIKLNLRIF